jgi:branched-chain amino acid transport system ATP-binding protein
MTTPVLMASAVTKRFLGITALDRVDLTVHEGELVGLIGPNGSGKTTLFNCIAGYVRADSGSIHLRGEETTRLPPHEVAMRRVGRTFQAARIFSRLTVHEHMLAAVQEFQADGVADRLFRLPRAARAEADAGRRSRELLEWVGLDGQADLRAASLSYGQRKLLAFAMALMPDPAFLMLDEPMAGVNPVMVDRIARYIRELHAAGRTVLVIEHNLSVVLGLCKRLVVMDYGRLIAEGSPAQIRSDPAVIAAYFGS